MSYTKSKKSSGYPSNAKINKKDKVHEKWKPKAVFDYCVCNKVSTLSSKYIVKNKELRLLHAKHYACSFV